MLALSINYKICSGCKIEKSVSGFYKNCSSKDGLQGWCKECLKKHQQSDIGKAVSKRNKANYRNKVIGYLRYTFSRMLYRCINPNYRGYKYYGGRGIKVCFTSDEFVDYVMNVLRVDPRGLQIDRIDNNGNYEPGNIQFVTCKENNNNRSDNRGY
ncbi:hypothetical protein LCGC14_2656000 [marine sediment metagenome]|uniref:Uncharacterized protein n=1 Tax=marine sediment metagenome TaxID=412755 RepID=A0A0F9C3R8_9ZZZZ